MPHLDRDGVRLFYEERGTGDPPMVLAHAWAGNHTNFKRQIEHFSPSHRVVAVDLRGHGESDKPQGGYTIAGFADDLGWMCHELEVRRPVVVGHSMGGLVAMQLAATTPENTRAVVALDSPILASRALVDAVQPLIQAMWTPAFRDGVRAFYTAFIGFGDDPAQRDLLLDELAAGERHVLAPALEDGFRADMAAAAAGCRAPVLYVSAGPWHADIEKFRELCPQLVTAQTVGSGHFHQLEVPDQINAMLARFMSMLPPEPVATD